MSDDRHAPPGSGRGADVTGDLFAPEGVRPAAAAPRRSAGCQPLAERMRPRTLDEVVGQDALLGPDGTLRRLLGHGALPSLILWGPPGSGKTTLARLLAGAVGAETEAISAVLGGVRELRAAVERAATRRGRTVLFVDEIHRFNRAQQDALLPHVEHGTVTLLGATTQNPSYEVNAALLSRCRVVALAPLAQADLVRVLATALADGERGLGGQRLAAEPAALEALAQDAGGDARRALSALELACAPLAAGDMLSVAVVAAAAQRGGRAYDRNGTMHHDVVSAFIKSMRGSDPDAALYYLARLLDAGEPPRFVLRRMVIFASEDVGLADPHALPLAVAALHAFEIVGLPEGSLTLSHLAAHLACAPKSHAVIAARDAAAAAVAAHGTLPVPLALRSPGGASGRALGWGEGYVYPPATAEGFVPVDHLPDALAGTTLLALGERGAEGELKAKVAAWRAWRVKARGQALSSSDRSNSTSGQTS